MECICNAYPSARYSDGFSLANVKGGGERYPSDAVDSGYLDISTSLKLLIVLDITYMTIALQALKNWDIGIIIKLDNQSKQNADSKCLFNKLFCQLKDNESSDTGKFHWFCFLCNYCHWCTLCLLKYDFLLIMLGNTADSGLVQ